MRLVKPFDEMPASTEDIQRYYEGAILSWSIIAARADVERDQFNTLVNSLSISTNQTRLLCLIGEPGSGKSTLAWRLAAEVAQSTGRQLLHIRNSEDGEVWYKLESFSLEYAIPLIVLVDDVFRGTDTLRALTSLDPNLNITIIASSRSNELPDALRLQFPFTVVELSAPTSEEKSRVLQRLKLKGTELDKEQQKRLQDANSWLVLMMEVTTGGNLAKIVRDSLNRLKFQDEVVYRAYEYLCYAGQYDIAVPDSLIAGIDSSGRFYNILEHPASKGLIFQDSRLETRLRTQHPTIAREALKTYRRDPLVLADEFIRTVQPTIREHRIFLFYLLTNLLLDGQDTFVRTVLEQRSSMFDTIMAACSCVEIVSNWTNLYRILSDQRKVIKLEEMALVRTPETAADWLVQFKLVEQKGEAEQIAAVIGAAGKWLTSNFDSPKVRAAYLRLVERHGAQEQIATLIETTSAWLSANPQDTTVRSPYLGLVARHGTQEQIATLIETTSAWLSANPQDTTVRSPYLGLVTRHGTREQIATLIETTSAWLSANPQDTTVRQAYLRLLERHGTQEQIATLIETTSAWLADSPQDTTVRQAYLRLLERHGTQEQIATLIETTSAWLADSPQDTTVRQAYLRLLERHGTQGIRKVQVIGTSTKCWNLFACVLENILITRGLRLSHLDDRTSIHREKSRRLQRSLLKPTSFPVLNPDEMNEVISVFELNKDEERQLHAALLATAIEEMLMDRINQDDALKAAEQLFPMLNNALQEQIDGISGHSMSFKEEPIASSSLISSENREEDTQRIDTLVKRWNLFARELEDILAMHNLRLEQLNDRVGIHREKVRRLIQSLRTPKSFPILNTEELEYLIQKLELSDKDSIRLYAALLATAIEKMLMDRINQDDALRATEQLLPMLYNALQEHIDDGSGLGVLSKRLYYINQDTDVDQTMEVALRAIDEASLSLQLSYHVHSHTEGVIQAKKSLNGFVVATDELDNLSDKVKNTAMWKNWYTEVQKGIDAVKDRLDELGEH